MMAHSGDPSWHSRVCASAPPFLDLRSPSDAYTWPPTLAFWLRYVSGKMASYPVSQLHALQPANQFTTLTKAGLMPDKDWGIRLNGSLSSDSYLSL